MNLQKLILAAAIAMSMASATAQTIIDQGDCGANGNNLTWVLEEVGNDTVLTISGSGNMENYNSSSNRAPWYSVYRVAIKAIVIGDSVTSIGDWAFDECISLTFVTIPDSVTTIGICAFANCSNLASVTIGNSVTTIGNSAFARCSRLTSVILPNSLTRLGDAAFGWCSGLTSVTIPDNVTTIGINAFFYCSSLVSVTIGNSVTSIGNFVFRDCNSLQTVNFNAINTTMGTDVFWDCTAFTTLNIGDSVKIIPSNAFVDCSSLTSVTIGNSVTTIGNSAFANCSSLTAINVDINNLHYVSENGILFNKSKTILIQYPAGKTNTSYTIPDSVTSIGETAFANCISLTSVTIGNSVTTIGNSTFARCSSLTSVIIPNSVTSLGDAAFGWCSSLTSVTIPDSVTTIGINAFFYCSSLISVTIGNSVTSIGNYVFQSCSSLQTVNFNAINTTMESDVFWDCTAFTTLNIGDSVKTIPSNAFVGCSSLASVISKAINPPTLGSSVFSNYPLVYIPCGTMADYQRDWTYFSSFIEMSDTTFIFDTVCPNTMYDSNGFNMPAVEDVYYSVNGCNVVCLTLTVHQPVQVTDYPRSICFGKSYSDNNFTDLTIDSVYSRTYFNINGCDSVVRLTLTVHPSVPTPVITQNGNVLTSSSASGNKWYFNNTPITGAVNQTYTCTQNGVYYVEVTNEHGCKAESDVINVTIKVGIVETDNYPSLRVYPNPTTNQLRITNYELWEDTDIQIYDIVGKLLQSKIVNLQSEIILDISHLANGMYFLKINNQIVKIIKE